VKAQAQVYGLTVFEVDGSRSVEGMAALVEQHFEPFLHRTWGRERMTRGGQIHIGYDNE